MWLKTNRGMVNMDRVATVEVGSYGKDRHYVEATIQVTTSEDFGIAPAIFTGNEWQCQMFIKWLYDQLAAGVRIAVAPSSFMNVDADEEAQP